MTEEPIPISDASRDGCLSKSQSREGADLADPPHLDRVDWPLLQSRDFKRDPEDPGKLERYRAGALFRDHVPLNALRGIVCFTEEIRLEIENTMQAPGVRLLPVHTRPNWYFR